VIRNRTALIVAAGALLLFAMEVWFSLQLQRYEVRRPASSQASPFFKGPIASLFRQP
jgi:hypothetical protein